MTQPSQIYRTYSSITWKNITTVQEHPNQEAQEAHLQILYNNLQIGFLDNLHFQHCCHLLYLLKYPGKVVNQPLQEGTNT